MEIIDCLIIIDAPEVAEIEEVLREPLGVTLEKRVAVARAMCGGVLPCGIDTTCIDVNHGEKTAISVGCLLKYCDGFAAGKRFVDTL